MKLPMKAFCIEGYNGDKISLQIDDLWNFPDSTSIEGGYDVKGTLEIKTGDYQVVCNDFNFATGTICQFGDELERCYENLEGKAHYKPIYEKCLEFEIEADKLGHMVIKGKFQKILCRENVLNFEIETDQSYMKSVLNDIEELKKYFGEYEGIGIIRKTMHKLKSIYKK